MTDCRKCSGSGQVFGGDCFACRATGKVDASAYTTTPAAESANPALRAERAYKPLPFIEPDPAHVARCLAELKAMTALEVPPEPTPAERIECAHEFRPGHGGPMCYNCGMFLHQWNVSAVVPGVVL